MASADELSRFEAIQLFVDRARGVRSNFRLTDDNAAAVAEICRRLDGLPLAIELATARLNLFSAEALRKAGGKPEGLGSGARDLPERQQTLRATIDWSYQLLTPVEQRLFELLSVFASASVEAVEAVASGLDDGAGRTRRRRRSRLTHRQEPRPPARHSRRQRHTARRPARDDQGVRNGPA